MGSEKAGLVQSESEEGSSADSSEETPSEDENNEEDDDDEDVTPGVTPDNQTDDKTNDQIQHNDFVDQIEQIKIDDKTEPKKEENENLPEKDENLENEISSVDSQNGINQEEDEEEEDDQEGEGNESDKANEDEDERYPAYIPRKGLFFLHDDRIDMDYPEGQSGAKMDLEASPEAPPEVDVDGKSGSEEEIGEVIEEAESLDTGITEEMDQEAERAMRAARK